MKFKAIDKGVLGSAEAPPCKIRSLYTHEKIRSFFVLHQSVNLLPDCIILGFLGVQNQTFREQHAPRPPTWNNIIVSKTVALQDYRPALHECILRNFHILTHTKFPLSLAPPKLITLSTALRSLSIK